MANGVLLLSCQFFSRNSLGYSLWCVGVVVFPNCDDRVQLTLLGPFNCVAAFVRTNIYFLIFQL